MQPSVSECKVCLDSSKARLKFHVPALVWQKQVLRGAIELPSNVCAIKPNVLLVMTADWPLILIITVLHQSDFAYTYSLVLKMKTNITLMLVLFPFVPIAKRNNNMVAFL